MVESMQYLSLLGEDMHITFVMLVLYFILWFMLFLRFTSFLHRQESSYVCKMDPRLRGDDVFVQG